MQAKTFEQLTKNELYAVSKLRQDVFIIEQNSVYCDLDGLDQSSLHYLDNDEKGMLQGYARFRQVEKINIVKIERVVLTKAMRGTGRGKWLILVLLNDIKRDLPTVNITLSAQIEAIRFYQKLGFTEQGEPYEDGGIPHITMLYTG
jgi:ElaA protein